MGMEQRQFTRVKITEQAVAVDDRGLQLGKVKEVGAGGMMLAEVSQEALMLMPVGRKLRINIIEPDTRTTTPLNVEVLYIRDDNVGVKFTSPIAEK
jgi:hypothetical protein